MHVTTYTHILSSFKESTRYFNIALYGGLLRETMPEGDDTVLASLGLGWMSGADRGSGYDPIYDDNW